MVSKPLKTMAEETENLDSSTEETTAEAASATDLDNLDASALKEKLENERKAKANLEEKNKQLFERAKKAETELKSSRESKEETTSKKETKSELEDGEKALLRTYDVKGQDEVELFLKTRDKFKDNTSMEEVLESADFQKQITELREEKKSREALEGTADSKRGGGGESKNKVEFWLNKGELPPDTAENRQLRRDVVNAQGKALATDNRFAKTGLIGSFHQS